MRAVGRKDEETEVCESGVCCRTASLPLAFFRPQCFFVSIIHERCAWKRLHAGALKIFWLSQEFKSPLLYGVFVYFLRSFFIRAAPRGNFLSRCAASASHQQQQQKECDDDDNNFRRPLCLSYSLSFITQVCSRKPRVILHASLIHCLLYPSPF